MVGPLVRLHRISWAPVVRKVRQEWLYYPASFAGDMLVIDTILYGVGETKWLALAVGQRLEKQSSTGTQ
jgi:hypothetical protein